MKVASWSNFHGRGTTNDCIAIALSFALNYKSKSLIMHTQYTRSALERAFLSDKVFELENILEFSDIGIDSLERIIKTGRLNAEEFSSYCNCIVDERLDLLTGSKKTSHEMYASTIGDTILNILDCANKYYDYIFLDLNSGMYDKITKKVLADTDILIVNIEQNEFLIKDFFENYYKELSEKKIILVIAKYDYDSKCSKKYIQTNYAYKYGYKDEIFAIPYNVDFLDSVNNNSVKKFFYANNKCVRNEINNNFFQEINLITNKIAELSSRDIRNEPIGSNNISSLIKNIFKVG